MSFISLSIVTLGLSACQGQPIEDVGTVAQASSVPPDTVLVLNGTGSPFGAGYESSVVTNAGYNVEVVDPVGWAAKTATDFADYKAIIIGAINVSANVHELDAAVLNAAWATAATGNIIVVGTDPGARVASGANLFSEDASSSKTSPSPARSPSPRHHLPGLHRSGGRLLRGAPVSGAERGGLPDQRRSLCR